jgi:hypothetical protein
MRKSSRINAKYSEMKRDEFSYLSKWKESSGIPFLHNLPKKTENSFIGSLQMNYYNTTVIVYSIRPQPWTILGILSVSRKT